MPKSNEKDIVIDAARLEKIEIIPVERIEQVLAKILDWTGKEKELKKIRGK